MLHVNPLLLPVLLTGLQGTPYQHQLQIIHADVMKVQLPYFDICVANIPYQISSPLTFKLLAQRCAAPWSSLAAGSVWHLLW